MSDEDDKKKPVETVSVTIGDVRKSVFKVDGFKPARNGFRFAAESAVKGFSGVVPSAKLLQGFEPIKFENTALSSAFRSSLAQPFAREQLLKISPSLTSGINSVLADIERTAGAKINAQLLASVKFPSLENMIGREVLDSLARFSKFARAEQILSIYPAARPIAPASRTPVRYQAQVRRFLSGLHPCLPEKLDGIYEAIDRPDGISQSANSAAELLRIVTVQLVPYAEVWSYMRSIGEDVRGNRGRSRPPKSFHLEVISIKRQIDLQMLNALSRDGALANRFEDLKHDAWSMNQNDALGDLNRLIDSLEDLLVFLARSLAQ